MVVVVDGGGDVVAVVVVVAVAPVLVVTPLDVVGVVEVVGAGAVDDVVVVLRMVVGVDGSEGGAVMGPKDDWPATAILI